MNKKCFLLVFTITLICLFSSCDHSDLISSKAKLMSDLECRAIALRNQRFALANQIRFAQDTMLTATTSNKDSIRLSQNLLVFNSEKEKLLQQSLLLADSIHKQLDSLRKFVFTKDDDQKVFNDKLKEETEKHSCEE